MPAFTIVAECKKALIGVDMQKSLVDPEAGVPSDAVVVAGSICVENYHAILEHVRAVTPGSWSRAVPGTH